MLGRRLRLQTHEGIEFTRPIASPLIRMLASMVDYGIILGALEIIQFPFTLFNAIAFDVVQAIVILASFLLAIGYSIYFEWNHRGQTIGKRILQIQVINDQGLKLSFSQVVIRNLLRVIDQIPLFYFVGGLAASIDKSGRRLGDIIAGTVVIRISSPTPPIFETSEAEKFNSLRDKATLVARLRQEISPELAETALHAIQRRDELEPQARIGLFSTLSERIRSLVTIPEETLEGLSDERLVLNVVEVLFTSKGRARKSDCVKTRMDAM